MSLEPVSVAHTAYQTRAELVRSFFATNAREMADLCHGFARHFARGGRILAFGAGAAATDAQHIAVEFVHPVIVGKRALPALAPANDTSTSLSAALQDPANAMTRQLDVLGRPEDIAIGIVHSLDDPGAAAVAHVLRRAEETGMLALGLGVPGSPASAAARHHFDVDSDDVFIVQEVHETLYHVLWELVHVFFEHRGLLPDAPPADVHDSGRSSFLYPFLQHEESDLDSVLDSVTRSVIQKAADVTDMRSASEDAPGLAETAALVTERVRSGGKIVAFGNGGSATDAQDLVFDLMCPPSDLPRIPAISLANDDAVVTAVANDVGFENVFTRQVIAHASERDVVVAISTSGGSRNVLTALEEARRRGCLTVAFAGYGGGRAAEIAERAHVVPGDYIPRLQEAQATQYHVLRSLLL